MKKVDSIVDFFSKVIKRVIEHLRWFKDKPEHTQNILLLLTLMVAVYLGVQQNKISLQQNEISSRLQQLDDFVAVVALPGQNDVIKLINTGKINLYVYGYKNVLAPTTTIFIKPRLISSGTLDASYFWIYTKNIIVPIMDDGSFSFNFYLKDEFNKKYVAEFGGMIEPVFGTIDWKVMTWTYRTYPKDWYDEVGVNGDLIREWNKYERMI